MCLNGENRNGGGNTRQNVESNFSSWYEMSPTVILYAFIPILVFESAFMTDTHIFSRIKMQILTLAGPGVLRARAAYGTRDYLSRFGTQCVCLYVCQNERSFVSKRGAPPRVSLKRRAESKCFFFFFFTPGFAVSSRRSSSR